MDKIYYGDWKKLTIPSKCYVLSIRRNTETDTHGTIALFFGTQIVSIRRFRKIEDICKVACNMIDRYIEKKGYYRYLKLMKIIDGTSDEVPLEEIGSDELYLQFLNTDYVQSLRDIQNELKSNFKVF